MLLFLSFTKGGQDRGWGADLGAILTETEALLFCCFLRKTIVVILFDLNSVKNGAKNDADHF